MTQEVKKAPYPQGAAKQKMWQAMRIMRTFTISDIAQTSEVSIEYARAFVDVLRRAGYLKREPTSKTVFAQHRLIRDTGPHAPRHWSRDKKVFDVNKGVEHALV